MPTNVILVTAGLDHIIRLWEPHSGFCHRTLQFTDSQVNKLEITPNKKYLAVAGNPHIKFFELNSYNPNPVSKFSAHKSNVTAIGFESRGEFLYSGSEDKTIKIWDSRAASFQKEFFHKEACNTLELHSNQNDLISGHQNGEICVHDLRAGKRRLEMMVDDDTSVRSLNITKDGTLCCCSTNKGECFVWAINPETESYFTAVKSWQAHNAYVLKVLYSPNKSLLSTCSSDGTIKLWNTSDYSLKGVLRGHSKWVWDCIYFSNSNYLISASSDKVSKMWNIDTKEVVMNYSGHHKAVTCIALSGIDYVHSAIPSKNSSVQSTSTKSSPSSMSDPLVTSSKPTTHLISTQKNNGDRANVNT